MAYVRGRGEVKSKMRKLARAFPAAAAAAMQTEAKDMLGKAVVNRDTGNMQNNAFVSEPVFEGARTVIKAGFATPYARYVNAKYQFLTRAIRSARRGYLGRLAKRTKRNVLSETTPVGEEVGVPTLTRRKTRAYRRRS